MSKIERRIKSLELKIDQLKSKEPQDEQLAIQLCTCYEELARGYHYIGVYKASIEAFLQAEQYLGKSQLNDAIKYMPLFIMAGKISSYTKSKEYDKSADAIEEANNSILHWPKDRSNLEVIGFIKIYIAFGNFWYHQQEYEHSKQLLDLAKKQLFSLDIPSLKKSPFLYATMLDCMNLAYIISAFEEQKEIADLLLKNVAYSDDQHHYAYFTYFSLGKMNIEDNQSEKAIADLEKARAFFLKLELNQEYQGKSIFSEILNLLCCCFIDKKQFDKAESYAKDICSLFQDGEVLSDDHKRCLFEGYYLRARVAAEKKKFEDSIGLTWGAIKTSDSIIHHSENDYRHRVLAYLFMAKLISRLHKDDIQRRAFMINFLVPAYQIISLLVKRNPSHLAIKYSVSFELCCIYQDTHQPESAIEYAFIALTCLKEMEKTRILSNDDYFRKLHCLYKIGQLSCVTNKYSQAMEYLYFLIELYKNIMAVERESVFKNAKQILKLIPVDINFILERLLERVCKSRLDKVAVTILFCWSKSGPAEKNNFDREYQAWFEDCLQLTNIEILKACYWLLKFFSIADREINIAILKALPQQKLKKLDIDAEKIKQRFNDLEFDDKKNQIFKLFQSSAGHEKSNASRAASSSSSSSQSAFR